MNTTGDAAEQTFRIVIEETEFVIRIAGSLLKETIAMMYAISKDNKQNSVGKTNLSNMLKNCKDIRIFTVQKKDLDKFVEEAKNYGIYYCTLIDKADKSDNAIVDIMVRGDDAPRVNRIVERFDLEITDTAALRTKSIKENGKEVIGVGKISDIFASMVNAIIMAPNTTKGERRRRRRAKFIPVCTWFTSLVIRVIRVDVPVVSSLV